MARRALALAGAVTVVLGVAIVVFPGIAAVLWGTAGALAAAGILFGIRTHQPARRAPWVLLAAAVAALGAGDVAYELSGRGTEQLSYTFALIDLLPYGRREEWQDSPDGWPQDPTYSRWLDSPDIAALYGPKA